MLQSFGTIHDNFEVMKVLKERKHAKTKKSEVEKPQSKTVRPGERGSGCETKKTTPQQGKNISGDRSEARFEEKSLLNGDVYIGKSKSLLPHGNGKYTWLDRAIYEGNWVDGRMTGNRVLIWPSGAKYEGEFSRGYLYGQGSFTKSSGCVYTGGWRMNVYHEIGKKVYWNSDIYEGLWKEGIPEVSGKYTIIIGCSTGSLKYRAQREREMGDRQHKRRSDVAVQTVQKTSAMTESTIMMLGMTAFYGGSGRRLIRDFDKEVKALEDSFDRETNKMLNEQNSQW